MKKRKLKNYLKLGILFFGILLLITNCEKDEQQFVDQQQQSKHFSLATLSKKEYQRNSNLNKVLENFSVNSFQSKNSEETSLQVDTSRSNYLESTDGTFHSYSFPILNPQSEFLENLVISLQPDGNYKSFRVTYNLSDTNKEVTYQEIDVNTDDYLNRNLTCTTTLTYDCIQTQTDTHCTDCDNPSSSNTYTVTTCVMYSTSSFTTCTQSANDLLNGSDELIYGDGSSSGGNFIWANGSSSSGYNNGGAPIEISINPCSKVKDLINSNSNTKLRLKQLLENNSNHEYGFQIRKNPTTGQNVPTNLFTNNNSHNLRFRYDQYTFVVAHKHPDGNNDGFDLFSGHDILNIAQLASNYTGAGSELPSTFTIFLVTGNSTFALTINNTQSLNNLIAHIETNKKASRFNEDLLENYLLDVDVLTGANSSIFDQQERLFQFLAEKNITASLLKASYNSNNEIEDWMAYNSNEGLYETCNE